VGAPHPSKKGMGAFHLTGQDKRRQFEQVKLSEPVLHVGGLCTIGDLLSNNAGVAFLPTRYFSLVPVRQMAVLFHMEKV
jgi:hypothetical protein